MDNFMRVHNINADLKGRAIKYLEFTWEGESKNLEKEQNLLELLPQTLKSEILFESNRKSLIHFKILKNNFSEEVLNKLSTFLRTIQFSPDEQIYSVLIYFRNLFIIQIRKEILILITHLST